MTDPRIEAAARELCERQGYPSGGSELAASCGFSENWEAFSDDAQAALEAADAAAWRLISEYNPRMGQVYCGHSGRKWLRHGRMLPGYSTRWYYSGTNERSQWAQQEGDEPTHWQPLPTPPNATPQAALDTITIPEVRNDRPIPGKDVTDG